MFEKFIEKYDFLVDSKFHHIGIGINNISNFDEKMVKNKIYDPIQKVNVYFIKLSDLLLEFVEPADENSPVSNSLKNNLNYFHICFETNNFFNLKKKFLDLKIRQISKPVSAVAFSKRKIVWFKSHTLGLIEMIINE